MHRRTRWFCFVLAVVVAVSSCLPVATFAQSGRGRQPTTPPPQPKPTTNPNLPKTTVLGVPEGGKLVRHDVDGTTSRFILRNGMTVILREKHSLPLVAVNISVKVGTVNEPDGQEGIARLVQQAILRGSSKRAGAAIEQEVARQGGEFHAETRADLTSFNLIAPAESYQAMAELLGDLILNPAFQADELRKAAQLVMLASKRAQDDAETQTREKLYSAAFTANRLKRGSAVSESFLQSVTREQVQAFYQSFYHPENTVVTIVGDVFTIPAIGQMQLNFGNYTKAKAAAAVAPKPEARPAAQRPATTPVAEAKGNANANAKSVAPSVPSATTPATPTAKPSAETIAVTEPAAPALNLSPQNPEESAQDKLRYGHARADIGNSWVMIGYRVPAPKADKDSLKEAATLQMLGAALGLGNGSRLWQGLREGQSSRDKTSVVFGVEAAYQALPGTGLLTARMLVDPLRIDRAEAEFFREIERFRRELIADAELQRARAMLEKQQLNALAELSDEANALAWYHARLGDYRLFDSAPARWRAVTAADIQQAAAKYLTLPNVTVSELEGRTATQRTFTPEKFAELIVTFDARTAQPLKPEDVKPAAVLKTFAQGPERNPVSEGQNINVSVPPLPIRDFSLLRGPRAYVREDKSRGTLSVGVFFQGGRLIEEPATAGTTELMLRLMMKSTTSRKADLIALELESYGGELQLVNEPDFFGFTLDVLSRNAEPSVKLLLDLIENPFFDKDELGKERAALLARQFQQNDDDQARSQELFWTSLYPGHPYGLPRFGLADAVKAIDVEKLEAWHAKTVLRQYPLVVLVGDTDGSSLVSRIFSEGLKRGELDKSLKVNLPVSSIPPQEQAEPHGRQLTTQTTGFRVLGQQLANANDYNVLTMLGTLAAASKLRAELRDKQTLAEDVRLTFEPRLASGAFFAQFASLPENDARSREAVQAGWQSLISTPPTDDEFEAGRNAAIGRYAIRLQTHPARLLEYSRAVIFGRKPTDIETQPDAIRAVKKTDLKRVAENVFKPNQAGRGLVRATRTGKE